MLFRQVGISSGLVNLNPKVPWAIGSVLLSGCSFLLACLTAMLIECVTLSLLSFY